VTVPAPEELIAALRAQPRAARLLDALAGIEGAHLVGGAVRDVLLGGEAVDLDVVVEGDAAAAARTAAERLGGGVREHERFGTATVETDDLAFDVARSRRERYPAPGALPEVEPAPLEEDLLRRDFTVNALAVAVGPPSLGELRAAPRGLEDLDARRLRVLHDGSFHDDPTRLLRLVRYAARLRFALEPDTEELARAAISAGAPATASGGRIGDELRLLLREPEPNVALHLAGDLGLDRALHPKLAPDSQAAETAQALLPSDGRRDLVVLAAACRGFEPEALAAWLGALAFPAPERDTTVAAALDTAPLGRRLSAAGRPSEVAAAARGRPPEAVALAAAVVPEAVDAAHRWLDELRHVGLEIDGDDLLAAGVPEGPEVGRALEAALARKLDGEATGREAELAAALAAVGRQ
jgi:tRNA nucleotidyltransferase (CCA-adding enzyme)